MKAGFIDDFIRNILSVPFCPYHFVRTILSVPFCPHHFVPYHFVLEPQLCLAMNSLSGCLASNRLLLNPTKTQFICLGSRRRLANVDRCLVTETFPHLVFCDNVRDLGFILDQELSFSSHINQLIRSCYYQLRQLRTVFPFPIS